MDLEILKLRMPRTVGPVSDEGIVLLSSSNRVNLIVSSRALSVNIRGTLTAISGEIVDAGTLLNVHMLLTRK